MYDKQIQTKRVPKSEQVQEAHRDQQNAPLLHTSHMLLCLWILSKYIYISL